MYVDKNVYHGELSAFFKSDREREEAKNFLLKALIELYDKNISGYLEVTTEGYPGIIVYMDTERGPAFEVTVIFSTPIRYTIRVIDPLIGYQDLQRLVRTIESLIVGFMETGGKGVIYFVFVPGQKIVPPRAESGVKSLLQKLFLGNLIFMFALSIVVSYAVYLVAGPYYTPIVLLLSQIPLILVSPKIVALVMGDWIINEKSPFVYLVGIKLSIFRYQQEVQRLFFPKRYEIKKRIYYETLGELSDEKIKEILSEYGLKENEYELEVRKINLYKIVSSVIREYNVSAPSIYLSNIIIPNAAATGVSSKFSSLVITTGLLTHLNIDELMSVIGHEISHLKRHDVVTFFVLSSLEYITRVYVTTIFWPLYMSTLDFMLLMIYMYISLTLLFFVAKFVEARADIDSALFLNRPRSLASALRKIGARKLLVEMRKPSARLMYWLSWDPHPPVSFRIENLERIADKDRAFEKPWITAISSCVKDFMYSLRMII
ncbi:MAG: hypothetical protein B6U94_00520 [Thermofilum sp. ex4484_79]|nr:MAG: hypothetical protein B6U94_00520 [Thermofilum sp. ex4484_79]